MSQIIFKDNSRGLKIFWKKIEGSEFIYIFTDDTTKSFKKLAENFLEFLEFS